MRELADELEASKQDKNLNFSKWSPQGWTYQDRKAKEKADKSEKKENPYSVMTLRAD